MGEIIEMSMLGERPANSGNLLRVVLKNPVVTKRALSKAKCLIRTEFNDVYLTADFTPSQLRNHKYLVEKLRNNVKLYPHRRWVIRNNGVLDVGLFECVNTRIESF